MYLRVWPLIGLLVLVLRYTTPAATTRVVLVAPSSFQRYEAVLKVAVADIIANQYLPASFATPINITFLAESANPLQDLEAARSQAQQAHLAIIASSNPTIAYTFGSAGVPTVLLGPSSVSESIPNGVSLAKTLDMRNSLISVFRLLQWTSTAVIYAPRYEVVKSQIVSTLKSASVSVTVESLIDPTLPATTTASIVTSLEGSSSRIVVVVSSSVEFQLLLRSVRETPFEFVWLDPLSTLSAHDRFNASFLNSSTAVGMPRGFLAIEANPLSASASLLSRFSAAAAPAAPAVDNGLLALAYDAMMLWAGAVKRVEASGGNFSNGATVAAALRNSTASAPGVITGEFSFDETSGDRVGKLAILNFRWAGAGTTGDWFSVGSYADATPSRPASMQFNTSATIFSQGTTAVPSSSQLPSITIGLLWATLRPVHAGWRRIAAMALEDINANSSVVPGRVVRAVFVDNLDSAAFTINGAQDLISRGVVGILGPARSTQTIALQYYIGGLGVPNIGHSSTADVLSDKLNFPTFFRTVIRDSTQAKAMVGFMERMRWKNFCLLNFADDYGSGVSANILIEAAARNMNVMARNSFTTTNLNVNETLGIVQRAGCRIIAFVADANTFGPMIFGAKQLGLFGNKDYVWIFSESIASDLTATGITRKNLTVDDFQGSFITRPLDGPPTSPKYIDYNTRIRQRAGDLGFVTDVPLFGGQLYDAVWTLALAAGQMISAGLDPLTQRSTYLNYIRSTSFVGVTGPVSFDKNQDRLGASYGIFNFFAETSSVQLIGVYTDTNDPASALQITRAPVFWDKTTNVPLDVVPLPVETIAYASGGAAVIMAVAALVLLAIVVTVVIVTVNSSNKLIHRSSPVFLVLILFGMALSAVSVFFWFGTPSPALCHLRAWFGFLGAAVSYGALLAKNWRLWYLFNEPSLRVHAIRNSQLFLGLSLVLAPMLIVLVLWSSLAPFDVAYQLNAGRTINYLSCVSPNDRIFAPIAFAYMFFAMVVGAVLSFKTRTLPDTFNESRYIALSTYNLLFVSAVGILVSYIMSFEPTAYPHIITVCLLFGCLVTFALLFVPKLWLLLFRRDQIDGTDTSGRMRGLSGPRHLKSDSAANNPSYIQNPSDVPLSSYYNPHSQMSTAAVQGSVISPASARGRFKNSDYDVDVSASISSNGNQSKDSSEESGVTQQRSASASSAKMAPKKSTTVASTVKKSQSKPPAKPLESSSEEQSEVGARSPKSLKSAKPSKKRQQPSSSSSGDSDSNVGTDTSSNDSSE